MSETPTERAGAAAASGSRPFQRISPPASLPLRHFGTAAISFLAFSAGLFAGAPRLVDFGFEARFALGLVHLLTIGWIAQTILGAWTQMIPVHGETPLVSVPGMKAAWWVTVAGAAAFIGALLVGSDRYWVGASLLYSGILGSLVLLGATHSRRERRDWGSRHFTASFLWLAAAGIVGSLMAVDRHRAIIFRDPDGGLIAHMHMALIGFGGMAVMGAGYRLFPGISARQLKSKLGGLLAFYCLQAGLLGLAIDALFLGRRWMPVWACLLAIAYVAYFAQMKPALSPQFSFNHSAAFILIAFIGGLAWVSMGVGMAFGWIPDDAGPRAAYVYAALVGFYTPVIFSQIHKIAPFLVWLNVYGGGGNAAAGAPTFEDLTSRPLVWTEIAALAAAVLLGLAGFWRESAMLVRWAGGVLLACAVAYALNTLLLFRHLLRRDSRSEAFNR